MRIVEAIGVGLVIAGVLIEGLGALAMASYSFRRRLPGGGPVALFSIGGLVFVVGAIVVWLGSRAALNG